MKIFQLQRWSAVALLVFMTIHMTFLHYDVQASWAPYEIEHATVMERLQMPVWKAIDIAFLGAVLIHALTGSYMVLTDLEKLYKYKKVLIIAASAIFVLAFIYGTITILSFRIPA